MQLSKQSRFARFSLFAAMFAAIVVVSSLPLYSAEDTAYTIQASANEVQLAFNASDRQGHVIQTLRRSDVAVVDNGWIIRQFRSFRPMSESPLNLVILIDASGSMASQMPKELAEVRDLIAHTAWAERDWVSILSFGGIQPQLICARHCTGKTAGARLSALHANGLTPLYDALLQAADMLTQNHDPQSRSAIILFSDGMDTISMHSLQDALQAAQNLQAAIYPVSPSSTPGSGGLVLNYLAASTGGLSLNPGKHLAAVFQTILTDLHSGYVLTYELPRWSTGHHAVRILPTSNPKLRFRSRQAYTDTADSNSLLSDK